MYETVLKGCEFAKCDLTGVRTFVSTFENVHFSKCSLSSMRVIETNFFHTEFEDCTFTAANWHYCIIAFSALYNVRATGAPLCLSFTAIIQTKLRDVDLYEANLDHCSFTRAKIIKCNFWKSTFHEPTFEDCTISNVGMNETMISDGVFFKSPLFACRVRLVHFDNCVFDESDIVGCALGGADLSSTILYESRLIDNRKSEGNDYPAVLP